MRTYGEKLVLEFDSFYNGLVVEVVNDKVVCRNYYKSEFGERQVESDGIKIDLIAVAKNDTHISQMREISRQIGASKFAIDESVVEFIASLREN